MYPNQQNPLKQKQIITKPRLAVGLVLVFVFTATLWVYNNSFISINITNAEVGEDITYTLRHKNDEAKSFSSDSPNLKNSYLKAVMI